MKILDIFRELKENIHTVVMATVDENGRPQTRVIDIMLYDEQGLYFITAKGKIFYRELVSKGAIALSGFKGSNTMSSTAISVKGEVMEVDNALIKKVFEENPYMAEIYPTEESRRILTVFKIYTGYIDYFDLSKKPIERYSLTFGSAEQKFQGYVVNGNCKGGSCGVCARVCPQGCINILDKAQIKQENCLHCGGCLEACPFGAVERR